MGLFGGDTDGGGCVGVVGSVVVYTVAGCVGVGIVCCGVADIGVVVGCGCYVGDDIGVVDRCVDVADHGVYAVVVGTDI